MIQDSYLTENFESFFEHLILAEFSYSYHPFTDLKKAKVCSEWSSKRERKRGNENTKPQEGIKAESERKEIWIWLVTRVHGRESEMARDRYTREREREREREGKGRDGN